MTAGALVIGHGSIGARHARLLRELGCRTAVVSRREVEEHPRYGSLEEALRAETPDYVVVANETAHHVSTLEALARAGFEGRVLVEKPLASGGFALPSHRFAAAFVGYQLRFHPVLRALRSRLAGQKILSAQAYVGQYLPDWRPGTDYRTSYSARADLGGGVLRDLSHELDYLAWIFGPWRRLAALGGRLSRLEIDSDDCWGVILAFADCPVATLQLNYLDRPGRRELVVVTDDHTYRADLIRAELACDGESEAFEIGRDELLLSEHRAALGDGSAELCSLDEGLAVVETVAAIERAAASGAWVER